jgi:hypothetical protein
MILPLKAKLQRQILNQWREIIADAGEEIVIKEQICENGPTVIQTRRGERTIPWSWLVEAGAVEFLTNLSVRGRMWA